VISSLSQQSNSHTLILNESQKSLTLHICKEQENSNPPTTHGFPFSESKDKRPPHKDVDTLDILGVKNGNDTKNKAGKNNTKMTPS